MGISTISTRYTEKEVSRSQMDKHILKIVEGEYVLYERLKVLHNVPQKVIDAINPTAAINSQEKSVEAQFLLYVLKNAKMNVLRITGRTLTKRLGIDAEQLKEMMRKLEINGVIDVTHNVKSDSMYIVIE